MAEKVRMTVQNTKFILTSGETLDVTISAGTAVHDGHPDFHRTIKLADEALYKAKKSGRNLVVAAKQPVMTYSDIVQF